ncbi:hypothetical protein AB9R17_08730 [Neisseria gonorrhoeae]
MIEDKKIVALNFAVEDGMTGASAAYHSSNISARITATVMLRRR